MDPAEQGGEPENTDDITRLPAHNQRRLVCDVRRSEPDGKASGLSRPELTGSSAHDKALTGSGPFRPYLTPRFRGSTRVPTVC